MKTLLTIVLLTILVLPSRSQPNQDAGGYLNFIGSQYEEFSKDMMSYASAVAHGKSARKVEKRRSELIQQVQESERNVRRMKPFNKDSKLRDSVANYFRICKLLLNEEYGKLVNLEDVAEQSYDAMEGYLLAKERAEEKLDDAYDKVTEQFNAFAASNNIRIIESESKLSKKIRDAGKVNVYYNQIYLLFFKSYKNEAFFLDGANKQDVNAMEQTTNALLASSTEALEKLGPIPAFAGDGSVKTACQQALSFYKKEASTHFPIMVEFYIKKENYEKIKKVMETKRPADTSQKDIDAFDKVRNEYNSWVTKFNKTSDESNAGRNKVLKAWNDTTENFLDRHTPKYK